MFSSVNRGNYEVRANTEMWTRAPLFRRLIDTNVHGTSFVKIRKNALLSIRGYTDILYSVRSFQVLVPIISETRQQRYAKLLWTHVAEIL